jgi:transcriptional regulator with XRE-family HTH domain
VSKREGFSVLSPTDRKIGLRVMFLRRDFPFSQIELAKRVGLTRDQLSNIEIGRVSLRAGTGLLLCDLFNVNPRWLATARGEIPMPAPEDFDKEAFVKFIAKNADRPFWQVWSDWCLTDVNSYVNTENVKAEWAALKKSLQKATDYPGGKTRLAEFLGEKLSSVSQWLTDSKQNAREPGADTALRMLKWVTAKEKHK